MGKKNVQVQAHHNTEYFLFIISFVLFFLNDEEAGRITLRYMLIVCLSHGVHIMYL